MKLDKTNLEKVSRLARLSISPAEADEVTRRIADTIALIDQMKSVDTAGVRPLAHPLDMTQRLRADEVTEAEAGTETGTEASASAKTATETETDTGAGAGAKTETETEAEAGAETAADRRDALQALAPATENGLYLVPKVIE